VNQRLVNVQNGKCIDVKNGKDAEGQQVTVSKQAEGLNQKWRIVYLDSKKAEPKTGYDKVSGFYRNRPFFIISRLPARRALEVVGGRNLVIKTKADKTRNSQLWYFDYKSKTIKSKQHEGKSIDIQNSGKSRNLQVWSTNSGWFQLYAYNGANIVNERGKVMDV